MKILAHHDNLEEIVAMLKDGQVLILPSETSYGLSCDAKNQKAVDRIFQIKQRSPDDKPLLVIVNSVAMAKQYLEWNDVLEKIANKYWPGSVTVVSQATSKLAKGVISPMGTLALRVTANEILSQLSLALDGPLVSSSANISGQPEVYGSAEIIKIFQTREYQPDAVLDLGQLSQRKPSTIVSVLDDKLKILRQGEVMIDLSL